MAETGIDHEHTETVVLAAQWIADQRGELPRPIVEVQKRFGLTAKEACEACAMASCMRVCRAAHG